MPSVTIRIGNNQHTDANFSWWEVWGSQTNHAIGDVIANAEWDSWFSGRYEFHTGLTAGQTWYYWARAAYDKGATVTGLVSLGSVTVAATGENMPAWTLKGRNAGTTGTPHNIDFNDLTEEAAPTTGDKLVGWLDSGELRMFDVGNLPAGGGSDGSSLPVFYGAQISFASNTAGATTSTQVLFDTADRDSTWQPNDAGLPQRFWLGVNFTFLDADVNVGNNTITEASHGFATGEGPVQFTNSGGTLPGGISTLTNYWIIVVDSSTFKLATSRANAIANSPVDITSAAGGGTHTCDRNWLVVPAGVTDVRLWTCIVEAGDLAGGIDTNIRKNALVISYKGMVQQTQAGATTSASNLITGPLPVTEGDRFSCWTSGADAWTIRGGADSSWFAIEVLGAS